MIFVFSCYILPVMFGCYLLESYSFFNERQKKTGSGGSGRWAGPGMNVGSKNNNHDILNEKRYIFNKR